MNGPATSRSGCSLALGLVLVTMDRSPLTRLTPFPTIRPSSRTVSGALRMTHGSWKKLSYLKPI